MRRLMRLGVSRTRVVGGRVRRGEGGRAYNIDSLSPRALQKKYVGLAVNFGPTKDSSLKRRQQQQKLFFFPFFFFFLEFRFTNKLNVKRLGSESLTFDITALFSRCLHLNIRGKNKTVRNRSKKNNHTRRACCVRAS